MYLVKDTDQCKSLVEKAKDHKVSFNTSLIELDEPTNLYDELPIYENLDIKTLNGYDSCIVIYSREKLKENSKIKNKFIKVKKTISKRIKRLFGIYN